MSSVTASPFNTRLILFLYMGATRTSKVPMGPTYDLSWAFRNICCSRSEGLPMTITLNHTVVPTRDKKAAAQFFARIFASVPIRKATTSRRYVSTTRSHSSSTTTRSSRATTTLSTSAMPSSMPSSAAFRRLSSSTAAHRGASTTVSSTIGTEDAVYFRDPDGHVLELMTVPQ
jgi:hypothetical protein